MQRAISPQEQGVPGEIEQEINLRLLPHIHGEANHEYPFSDAMGLSRAAVRGALDLELDLVVLKREAKSMGKEFGDAFRYLVYLDLKQRLAMFRQFIEQRASSAKDTHRESSIHA